jgi:RNA polymerase sigma factor (sigma-70 family)
MLKDREIIHLLRNGKNTLAFEKIYRHFPSIKKLVMTHGGSEEEAKDIFQESVIVFYEKVSQANFELSSSIATFLYSISNHLWLKKVRDIKSRETNLNNLYTQIPVENEMDIEKEEQIQIIDKLLEELGNPCKTLLKNYYYLKMSMKEIAQAMSYSSENVAKNQKYKCLERAKKIFKDKLGLFQSLLISDSSSTI